MTDDYDDYGGGDEYNADDIDYDPDAYDVHHDEEQLGINYEDLLIEARGIIVL